MLSVSVLHVEQGLRELVERGWLANELQRWPCVHLSTAGVTEASHRTLLPTQTRVLV